MKTPIAADDKTHLMDPIPFRPGRIHKVTAARNQGIGVCFQHFQEARMLSDDGY